MLRISFKEIKVVCILAVIYEKTLFSLFFHMIHLALYRCAAWDPSIQNAVSISFFLENNILIICVFCLHLCIMCMPCAYRGLKRAPDP